MASAIVLGGCGKSQVVEQGPAPMEIEGVKVDMPKLGEIAAQQPELQTPIGSATMNIRYRKYQEAIASLEKISNDSRLTDQQKKVVADVIAQLKQVLAKSQTK